MRNIVYHFSSVHFSLNSIQKLIVCGLVIMYGLCSMNYLSGSNSDNNAKPSIDITTQIPDYVGELPLAIKNLILMLRDAHYKQELERNGASLPIGYLLYGPPGNGKTLIARAIAKSLNAPFFAPKLSELKSKWQGESAANIDRLFEEARKAAATSQCGKAIIFLDEIDAVASPRTNNEWSLEDNRIVNALLVALDGMTKDASVIVIGATNKDPRQLDPAIVRAGRLGKHIKIEVPERKKREEIAACYIQARPLYHGMNHLSALVAERSEGWSAADIEVFITDITVNLITAKYFDQNTDCSQQAIETTFQKALDEQNKTRQQAVQTEQAFVVLERLTTKFSDIAGGVSSDINNLLLSFSSREYQNTLADNELLIPKGYLLYGPSGSGKTLIVRAIAGELGAPFFAPKLSELSSQSQRVSAVEIDRLFEEARKAAAASSCGKAIIFLDKIDAEDNKVVNSFFRALDGVERDRSVIVIGATHVEPKQLGAAIVGEGRLSVHIPVELPEEKRRRDIAASCTRNKELYRNIGDLPDFIARLTAGWSPADIQGLVNNVTRSLISTQHFSPSKNQNEDNIRALFGNKIKEKNMAKGQAFKPQFQDYGSRP